jgi:hypothetical protein
VVTSYKCSINPLTNPNSLCCQSRESILRTLSIVLTDTVRLLPSFQEVCVCASVLFHACEKDSLVYVLWALVLMETVFVNSVESESMT